MIASTGSEHASRLPGSFRDPAGHVFVEGDAVLRTVSTRAAPDYEFVERQGVLDDLCELGWVVGTRRVAHPLAQQSDVAFVLRHERLDFISYPYEWSFSLLKAAALRHLEIQLRALDKTVVLSDASAFNMQFRGVEPTFIDVLSFRRYREGELWTGHRQFCEQFLNPLLLRSHVGIPHNAWFRGSGEGIAAGELAAVLPWYRRIGPGVLMHVVLPARLQGVAARKVRADGGRLRERTLSRARYRAMLVQLHGWIERLAPRASGPTEWQEYARCNTYEFDEARAKEAFVADFVATARPRVLWDLGCNDGSYAALALAAGAGCVIGFDADYGALEKAYARARDDRLAFLPLYQDAANPSPDLGWRQAERTGLEGRRSADAVLALAFAHHLAIARNVPLPEVVDWLVGLAPCGVIEFVPKADSTVQTMLATREDIFDSYDVEVFRTALAGAARLVREQTVSASGRTLFHYDRSQ